MPLVQSILSNTASAMAAVTSALALNAASPIHTGIFPADTKYEVCFTPGSDCTSLIVGEIDKAQTSLQLQAYSFTSKPIARAISDAKKRGIDVTVILDKSQTKHNKYSSAKYLTHQGIPVYVDYQPAIAHNKVIIIDDNTVITGSFNFTKAAQYDNAENVLVIHDKKLASLYAANLQSRKAESKQLAVRKRTTAAAPVALSSSHQTINSWRP